MTKTKAMIYTENEEALGSSLGKTASAGSDAPAVSKASDAPSTSAGCDAPTRVPDPAKGM